MQSLRRAAASTARTARPTLRQPTKRFASDAHGSNAHAHGHADATRQTNAQEGFSTFFYATVIGCPALLYGVYLTSRLGASYGSQKPYLTSLIEIYEGWKDEYARRNDLHVKMIQQAAEDRNLFLNSDDGNRYVDLKFPEQFNVGSPYNVQAGHGGINLNRVIAHYEKKNFDEYAEKRRLQSEGKLKGVDQVSFVEDIPTRVPLKGSPLVVTEALATSKEGE